MTTDCIYVIERYTNLTVFVLWKGALNIFMSFSGALHLTVFMSLKGTLI